VRICTACATTTDESGSFCPDCGAALAELAGVPKKGFARATTAPADTADRDEVAASSTAKLLGTVVDSQFKIESILGGGAFGTVYRGTQVGLDRPVAVKIPTHEIASDPVMCKRFAREARSAARIHHPGIVAIYAVGELADTRPYLAMQYVEGEPLDKILADGPISAHRALRIARSIASALSETHAADVVHRDLKPSNIVWRLDRNGDDQITIVDFGIAVCKPGNADATRLTAGGLIGTPHYMSPEQAHGEEVDARADLYALGCLLFELVTGSPLFDGSGFEVLLAHLGRPAPIPSERNPAVPEAIDRLCGSLLEKKPDDRPQTADDVIVLIDAALAELSGLPAPTSLVSSATRTRPDLVKKQKPKKTLATRRDLPEGTVPPRPRRTRRLVLGGAAALAALAAAGFAVAELRGTKSSAAAGSTSGSDTIVIDNDPRVMRRRTLFKDNGEMIVQAMVPDPMIANQNIRSRLEIKNKLGQPIVAPEIVITIADASGTAKGLVARPRGETKGRYYFSHTYPAPGTYTLRVFPPSIDSVFEIPIEVQ
jgi:serine/threonine protein kinase